MEYASVQIEFATLLRRRPLGTTADINKYTVAYWDGHEVRGIHLHRDNSARLAGDFDLDERTFNQMHADLVAWMAAPHYTVRPELAHWLKGAP
ncbi:hypothetical protein [Caballeronia mineralivorans]|jgi:hypothetical protein|uniref:hypothetical protein n=1 Tax=Caballeronia mineralivorans TaxID=2010198 RepID=UPI0023F4B163|nr:hypothetical protein [Caballeronia mineralivorans]MDB5789512.1 hypothetical protein [Caballeronia mineralivorans]MEA3101947.1 hypothetical protein [Caballeronia mineralivorans]